MFALVQHVSMKLHGYSDEGKPEEAIFSGALAEVTLEAAPEELRAMAAFFLAAADEMDRMGTAYDHMHLGDAVPLPKNSPHLTVFRLLDDAGDA